MAVSKLNDPGIGGQLIDDHNPFRQHPHPNKGLMDGDDLHSVITSIRWMRKKAC